MFSRESGAVPGDTDVRAGESSAEDVDLGNTFINLPHVLVLGCVGPVLGQYPTTERIDLAVPQSAPPGGPLESEFQASDAAEQ